MPIHKLYYKILTELNLKLTRCCRLGPWRPSTLILAGCDEATVYKVALEESVCEEARQWPSLIELIDVVSLQPNTAVYASSPPSPWPPSPSRRSWYEMPPSPSSPVDDHAHQVREISATLWEREGRSMRRPPPSCRHRHPIHPLRHRSRAIGPMAYRGLRWQGRRRRRRVGAGEDQRGPIVVIF